MDGRADVVVDVASSVGASPARRSPARWPEGHGCSCWSGRRPTATRSGARRSRWGVAAMLGAGPGEAAARRRRALRDRVRALRRAVDPAQAEAAAVPLDRLLPGVPGVLDVGHPEACEALARAAADGARPCCAASGTSRSRRAGGRCCLRARRRGTTVAAGSSWAPTGARPPSGANWGSRWSRARPHVGRRHAGRRARRLAGRRMTLGTEGDLHYLVFPRAGGRARLYLCTTRPARPVHRPGPRGGFLDAFRLRCLPDPGCEAASPAGPARSTR